MMTARAASGAEPTRRELTEHLAAEFPALSKSKCNRIASEVVRLYATNRIATGEALAWEAVNR